MPKKRKFLVEAKERLKRLRLCFYALEIGTIACSVIDKVLTYLNVGLLGAKELNPIASGLMSQIGVLPAVIVGFLATITPMLLIHLGIHKFKFDSEGHYWIYTFVMTVYFSIFFKLVESEFRAMGWI